MATLLSPEAGAKPVSRRIFRRLAFAGAGIALLLGVIAIAVELERVDRIVVDLTVAEANRFLEAERMVAATGPQDGNLEGRLRRFLASRPTAGDGHFVETEIYSPTGAKLAEAAIGPSAWQGAAAALTHELPSHGYWYRKHLVGTSLFVQVVVPYDDGGAHGFFEGVFEVAPSRVAEMLRASLIAIAGVVLAALATTGALYPVIVRMNGALADYAQGLERALREARSANSATRAKSRFLATMSHELRTPLHGMIGALEILDRTPNLPPAAVRLVAIAQSTSAQLLAVIGDILDFSKIEAGRLELEDAPFDPRATLGRHAETFAATAAAKGIGYRVDIARDVPSAVRGDAARLRQILGNLISNAIKFTDTGRVAVSIATEPAPGREGATILRLSVADTGIGIDPQAIGRIFEPYAQIDAAGAPRTGGTGLGLPISRQIAERMGGTLAVESAPGRGSTFVARIPLPVANAVPSAPEAPARRDPAARRLRVLVADDNPVNREIVAGQLAQIGVDAALAADGREAVALFESGAFDVVLLDGQMPELDGAQAAAAIRQKESGAGRRTPILALTASADPAEVARYRAAGMDEVVVKPATIDRLSAVLDRFADGSGPAAIDFAFLAAALGDLDAPWVADAMRGFAGLVGPQIDSIRAAVEAGDLSAAEKTAHSALGAARSAGASELCARLEETERLVRAGEGDAACTAVDRCRDAFARARQAIERRWGV